MNGIWDYVPQQEEGKFPQIQLFRDSNNIHKRAKED